LLALDREGGGQAHQLLVRVVVIMSAEPLQKAGLRLVEGADEGIQPLRIGKRLEQQNSLQARLIIVMVETRWLSRVQVQTNTGGPPFPKRGRQCRT